jgi:hypothetical protein
MIDSGSEEENLLRSRPLIIDSMGRRSGGKSGWDRKSKSKKKEIIEID